MLIQAVIGGYADKPVVVLSHYDDLTGIVSVLKIADYSEKRLREDLVLITNMRIDDRDAYLTPEQISRAIPHYFVRKSQGTLTLDSTVSRISPDNKIQVRAVSESGQSYEVSPDVTCGQMAILATIAYLDSLETNQAVSDAWEEINGFTV